MWKFEITVKRKNKIKTLPKDSLWIGLCWLKFSTSRFRSTNEQDLFSTFAFKNKKEKEFFFSQKNKIYFFSNEKKMYNIVL